MKRGALEGTLIGIAIGDALGVPVEFRKRSELQANPVTDFTGFGTHDQPPGTWSDDTSLTLCLVEALLDGLDYGRIAQKFVSWRYNGYMTAHGETFDIGNATAQAIFRLRAGCEPTLAGDLDEHANGNGSLMRIAPIAFFTSSMELETRRRIVFDVAGITHGHPRSKFGCWLFTEFLRNIARGQSKEEALSVAHASIQSWVDAQGPGITEWIHFARCTPLIQDLPMEEIKSTGYVVHTLEASLWCFLRSETFADAVLAAVNLGDDTDTTGAVAGAMAGAFYTTSTIPQRWIDQLAQMQMIRSLAERFCRVIVACEQSENQP
ncbi:MAG: ADP-ribosylglycohydrolase family protein [Leptospirales bacterium]|nr:ADP-ribosylglycohydrolase family protein [Leptospirales bacterium]